MGLWSDGAYGTRVFSAAGFTGSVSWASDGGGYKGSFGGWYLKRKFQDRKQAEEAVERLAAKKARELLEAISAAELTKEDCQ